MVAPHIGPPSTIDGRKVAGDQAQAVHAHAQAMTTPGAGIGCHAMPASVLPRPSQDNSLVDGR